MKNLLIVIIATLSLLAHADFDVTSLTDGLGSIGAASTTLTNSSGGSSLGSNNINWDYVTYDPKDASFSGVSDLSSGNYQLVRPKKRVHHKSRDVSQDWDEARYERHMDKLQRIAKSAGPTDRRIARDEIRANKRKYAKKYNMPGTKAERNNTTTTFNDAIGRNSHFFLRD